MIIFMPVRTVSDARHNITSMSENENQLIESSGDGDDAKVKALIANGTDVNALVVRTIALFILRLH